MKTNKLAEKSSFKHLMQFICSFNKTILFSLVLIFELVLPMTAASADTTISQGYSTTQSLPLGSIVSLVNNSTDQVSAATSSNVDSIVGVVVNGNDSLLSLSSGQTSQVQVATSGIEEVLVSNINGNIYQGDEITASPVSGVGMLATSDIKVVGIAQGNLNNTNGSIQSYTSKSGQKNSILVGEVPVIVNVSYYYKQPNKTLIPTALQNIADSLAGKPVSPVPILISMGIFIVTLFIVSSMVYSMIHSSIISVGRNPLSQSAIYRDILQLTALVVGILVVAVVLIYMILTKV